MELSTSMKFVMMRATAEANAAKKSELTSEFLLLGILKLAEVSVEDFAPSSRHKTEINADIDTVKAELASHGIDSTRTRGLLRAVIASGASLSGEAELTKPLMKAAENAAKRGASDLWAQDVLSAILEEPTDAILQVCPLKKKSADEKPRATDAQSESVEAKAMADEMSRDYLPELTSRIRHMRAKLLSTVHGQVHVVHAFTDGMFAAEVLAASDEKRKRPRAIFVFAGPPGVGKTFLAEQADHNSLQRRYASLLTTSPTWGLGFEKLSGANPAHSPVL